MNWNASCAWRDVIATLEILTRFDKKETMKIFKIILLIILVGLISTIIFFFYFAFSGTTWGGWTPPSTELILTQKESNWKKQVETNYNCEVNSIGLDGAFQQDSVIYMLVTFGDNSILKNDLNEDIEIITKKISSSFVISSQNKRKQTHILIVYSFIHNYNKDTVVTTIPTDRQCLYNIKSKTIIPTYKNLIIPKFGYFDFSPRENDLFYYKIGQKMYCYFNSSTQNDTLLKYYYVQQQFKFKSLDSCQSYTSKLPYKIEMREGYIESIHKYVFFENKCVSVKVNYKCFPKNKNIKPMDFIKKVTEISPQRLKNSKKEKLDLIGIIKRNNYNLQKKLFDVKVKFKVDSLKQPWSIEYETSLDEFKYYKTYEY